jgi:hypothetical protein
LGLDSSIHPLAIIAQPYPPKKNPTAIEFLVVGNWGNKSFDFPNLQPHV